ncbi:MAG: MerR family transcriptional regulator [Bacteroidales bacterium]|nr:MerR family transcriptional regulator [Bacteroidales bacterium]
MAAYTIRELENLSGIKAHTIRIWEKRYGLISPQRTPTNIRTYCDEDLKKLLNISVLNRSGVKISSIARLSDKEIVDRIKEITNNTGDVDSQIECLTSAMIDLDEYNFEQVLAKSIIHFGFEDMAIRILYPLLNKIGLMWQTGSINPAQEHFISNLIRQKLFVAIDGLAVKDTAYAKRFIFFLPEGELHELVLLFLCYLAKKRGHQVIYLGQSVPLNDLVEVIRVRQVDYLVTSVTSSIYSEDPAEFISRLSKMFADKIIYIGGPRIDPATQNYPPNIKVLSSPAEFQKKLGEFELTHINN